MARATIYISEENPVADILARCPLALRVMEKYFGHAFLKRDDLDKISLSSAVTMCHQQMHPILLELNRICI
jgi:hypothetical protein